MKIKKLLMSGIVMTVVLFSLVSTTLASSLSHVIKSGETLWILSQKYAISMDQLMQANHLTMTSVLYVGQTLTIPLQQTHTVVSGDTYWVISVKYGVDIKLLMEANKATANTMLMIGQKLIIPGALPATSVSPNPTPVPVPTPAPTSSSSPQVGLQPTLTYVNYTIKAYDSIWSVAIQFGIPMSELCAVNQITESTSLMPGKILKIPVHNIPIKATPGPSYGELLDWWTEAQYVVKVNASFEVLDFYTGKSFVAKRTIGANHADCETLSLQDTQKMKEIWGGNFSWSRRPVLIKIDGRKIAASASAMPHAGNDAVAGGAWASWRSGGYGAGPNFDYVKNNGADGHFDIYFSNSTRHSDGLLDSKHQTNVLISAGK